MDDLRKLIGEMITAHNDLLTTHGKPNIMSFEYWSARPVSKQ